MTFGRDLKAEFSRLWHKKEPTNEIPLFRILCEAILSQKNYITAEIHGNRCQVEFKQRSHRFSSKKSPMCRCELGDLLIVAFSALRKEGRIVIIQNKVARKGNGKLRNTPREVNASLVQYELLYERPMFQYVGKKFKGSQDDILFSSPYSSVSLYGIFYENGLGEVDMSSITARELQLSNPPKHPITGTYPCAKLILPSSCSFQTKTSCFGDFAAAENLINFGDLLEDLYIGRPITQRIKTEIIEKCMPASKTIENTLSARAEEVLKIFDSIDFPNPSNMSSNLSQSDSQPGHFIPMNICRSVIFINVDRLEQPLDVLQAQNR